MVKKNEQSKKKITIWFGIISFLVIVLSVCPSFSNTEKIMPGVRGSSIDRIKTQINEYKTRIIEIQLETIDQKENLEWLELKIKRMKSMNQKVSGNMQSSIKFKKLKLSALEKEKNNNLSHFNALQNELDRLETIASKKFSSDKANAINAELKKTGLNDWVELSRDQVCECYKLKTILPIFFTSGSAEISGEYNFFLKHFALLIKGYEIQIVVDGYADIDPIHTKQYPSNFELGAIRAANVVHALIKNGVKPSAFKIASTGKFRFPDVRKMSPQKAIERYVNITVVFSG